MKNLTTIFIFLFIILSISVHAQQTYVSIGTCSQLNDIRNDLTDNYRIIQDIDCTGTKHWNNGNGFLPLGNFTGTLDGQGFIIDGLTMNLSGVGEGDVGLFNRSIGTIENLIFTDINFTLDGVRGGVIAGLNLGDISTIFIQGNTYMNGLDFYGGLVGQHNNGTIEKISLDLVTTDEFLIFGVGVVGGIVGSINFDAGTGSYPILRECRIEGTMKVNGSNVGGVVGNNYDGIIEDCYGINSIEAGAQANSVGGFIAENHGYITNSYTDGVVTANRMVSTSYASCFAAINFNSITWSYTSCDLILREGAGFNGSFAAFNNQSLIKVYALVDYYTPPFSDQYDCIGNQTGTFNDCVYAASENNFYSYGFDPIAAWDFVDRWDDNNFQTDHATLQFEVDAEFDVIIEEQNLIPCVFPVLFCDDFNYAGSMTQLKDWEVRNSDDSHDTLFEPRNGLMIFNETNPNKLQHWGFENFPVNYTREDGFTITASIYAPSFSNEFTIFTNNTDTYNRIDLRGYDFENDDCFDLRVQGNSSVSPPAGDRAMQLWVRDYVNDDWFNVSNLAANTSYRIKVTSYFNAENKTDIYGFNTSYERSHLHVWVNGSEKHTHILGEDEHEFSIPNDCDSIKTFEIDRRSDIVDFVLDDYYMYVGSDQNIVTIYDQLSIISPALTSQDVFGNETGEVAVTMDNMWDTIGLKTQASRIIMALTFLFFGTLALIGGFLASGHNPNVGIIAFCNFLFMLLLTYLGLLPIWIVIAVTSFGLLGFVLWFKFAVLDTS